MNILSNLLSNLHTCMFAQFIGIFYMYHIEFSFISILWALCWQCLKSHNTLVTFQTNEIFFCTGSMCDQCFHLCLVVEVNPLVWQSVKWQLKTLFLCQWLLYRCHCRKTLSDTKQTFYDIKKYKNTKYKWLICAIDGQMQHKKIN